MTDWKANDDSKNNNDYPCQKQASIKRQLQSKCIKAGFLTVPLILEGAHTKKKRAGDCEGAFFVSLQYVVGS